MYEYLKKITQHSAIYSIGNLAALLPGFVLIPLYTHYFTPAEYGAMTLVLLFSNILMMLYEGGMVSALSRQYFEYREDDAISRRAAASTSFLFVVCVAAALSAVVFLAAKSVSMLMMSTDRYAGLIRIMAVSTFFGATAVIPQTLARIQQRSVLYISISISMVILSIILNVFFLVGLRLGLEGIFFANLITVFAGASLFVAAMLKSLAPWKLSARDLSAMLRFGMLLLPSALMAWVIDYSGRYILEKLVSLHDVGVYSLGNKVAQVMMLAVKAFVAAWFPVMFAIVEEEDSIRIFGKIFTYYIFALALLSLGISVFGREILSVLSRGDYREAYIVIPFIAVAYTLFGVYLFFVSFMVMKKRFDTQFISLAAAAAVNIALNIILIPRFGMMGCAFAAVLSYAALGFLTFRFSQRQYAISLESGRLLKMAALTVCAAIAGVWMKIEPVALAFAVKTLLMVVYIAALYKLDFFHSDEIAKLKRLLTKGRMSLTEVL